MSICVVLLYNSTIPHHHNIHSTRINRSLSLKKKFKIIATTLVHEIPVVTPTLLPISLVQIISNCKQNGDN